MKKHPGAFKVTYFTVFALIPFLTLNLFLDIILLPEYLLPLILVIGALMFVADAVIQKKNRNKKV